jgi:hypothetical protein
MGGPHLLGKNVPQSGEEFSPIVSGTPVIGESSSTKLGRHFPQLALGPLSLYHPCPREATEWNPEWKRIEATECHLGICSVGSVPGFLPDFICFLSVCMIPPRYAEGT